MKRIGQAESGCARRHMLILTSPDSQDIPILIKMNPERSIRHPKLERNLLDGNISRSAAIGKADAWMKDDPYLPWQQAREHNRGDTLKPFARVFEVSCHDKGG